MNKYIIGIVMLSVCLVSCNRQQSICLYDPDKVLDRALMRDCTAVYDLKYNKEENGFWGTDDTVPSKCELINIVGVLPSGLTIKTAQYKATNAQSATSAKVIIKGNELGLENIYTDHSKKNETCKDQYKRHLAKKVKANEVIRFRGGQ